MLAPVLVALILSRDRGAAYVAAALFTVGAATDRLDGYLARRYQSVTRTGQWLDPLADKLLVAAPVVTLTAIGDFPLWAAVVIVAREALVSVLRAWLGLHGRAMPASSLAKVKTGFQLLAILFYLIPGAVRRLGPLPEVALVVAVGLTIWSGIEYLLAASRPERR